MIDMDPKLPGQLCFVDIRMGVQIEDFDRDRLYDHPALLALFEDANYVHTNSIAGPGRHIISRVTTLDEGLCDNETHKFRTKYRRCTLHLIRFSLISLFPCHWQTFESVLQKNYTEKINWEDSNTNFHSKIFVIAKKYCVLARIISLEPYICIWILYFFFLIFEKVIKILQTGNEISDWGEIITLF